MEITKSCMLAFLVTIVVLSNLARIAPRIGLVDKPGGRKQHEVPTPVVGGLAMFCGFTFSVLTLGISRPGLWSFLAGATVLVLVGVFDDMRELGPRTKLLWQIAACLIMTLWGGVVLADLGTVSGVPLALGTLALPFSVFAAVGVINALNMIDGVDGLAGSLSVVALIPLAILAALAGQPAACSVLLLLISVAAAFLTFNLHLWFHLHIRWCPHKTVFMGDAGSMFLGFTLA